MVEFKGTRKVQYQGQRWLAGRWSLTRDPHKALGAYVGNVPRRFVVRLVRATGAEINLAQYYRGHAGKLHGVLFADVIGGGLQLPPLPRKGDRIVAREVGASGKIFYTFHTF